MKRGTPDHPKTLWLQMGLNVAKREVVGILEMLWHFTAAFAPRGDIGKWSDEQIAKACDWPLEDAAHFVLKLDEAGFLDKHVECRYIVHDWPNHADQGVKKYLKRNGLSFIIASVPDPPKKRGRAGRRTDKGCTETSDVRTAVAVAVAPATSTAPAPAGTEGSEGGSARDPDPPPTEAVPVEARAVEVEAPFPPPPVAVPVYRAGDTLPDGRRVLEVDAAGRALVITSADTPERRELRELREQIAAELPRCATVTGIHPDRLLAMDSALGSRPGFVSVDQIPTVPWARKILEKLQARRLRAEGEAQGQQRERPTLADRMAVETGKFLAVAKGEA